MLHSPRRSYFRCKPWMILAFCAFICFMVGLLIFVEINHSISDAGNDRYRFKQVRPDPGYIPDSHTADSAFNTIREVRNRRSRMQTLSSFNKSSESENDPTAANAASRLDELESISKLNTIEGTIKKQILPNREDIVLKDSHVDTIIRNVPPGTETVNIPPNDRGSDVQNKKPIAVDVISSVNSRSHLASVPFDGKGLKCIGNQDPFKVVPVEGFVPPASSSVEDTVRWTETLLAMKRDISKLKTGGEPLRSHIRSEILKIEQLRRELFCKYL